MKKLLVVSIVIIVGLGIFLYFFNYYNKAVSNDMLLGKQIYISITDDDFDYRKVLDENSSLKIYKYKEELVKYMQSNNFKIGKGEYNFNSQLPLDELLKVLKMEKEQIVKEIDISQYREFLKGSKHPDQGYVADAETARKIGETILNSIYGSERKYTLNAGYDSKEKVWIIYGNNDEDPSKEGVGKMTVFIGGQPYIAINQIDGKILGVWHTK